MIQINPTKTKLMIYDLIKNMRLNIFLLKEKYELIRLIFFKIKFRESLYNIDN